MPCAPPSPRPAPRPTSYALLSARQYAREFNQPLTFDTFSVKDMSYMFLVRSARGLRPIYSRTLPCTLLASPSPAITSRLCRPAAPRPASYALILARQYARAFNQPLSFDTSSVAMMSSMFKVRSARVCPQCVYSSPPLARCLCAVVTQRLPSPSSHLAPRVVCPPLSRLGSTRRRSTNR